jgi:serine/threonine protein kinase
MKAPEIHDVVADKYQLIHMLGRGSMGEVWLARHKSLFENVAIKLLTQTLESDEEERAQAAARFGFEARVAARLARKTRHIVQVTDHGEAEGGAYLVMEFLDGATLETRLSGGDPVPPEEVQELVRQVARALDCAHAEGVLHRDLKPANLFLAKDEDGRTLLKILDFGIAQIMRGHAPTGSFSMRHDLIFGTPGYMSPEQAMGRADLDGRCDLWALATIAYEALTDQLPVAGETVSELLDAARSARTIPVSRYRPDLPQSVVAFFERAFAEDLDARFATAADLLRAFDSAFAAERPSDIVLEQAPASDVPPPVTLTPAPRRSRATTFGLVTLIVALLVGVTWRSRSGAGERLAHSFTAQAPLQSPAGRTLAALAPTSSVALRQGEATSVDSTAAEAAPVDSTPAEAAPAFEASASTKETELHKKSRAAGAATSLPMTSSSSASRSTAIAPGRAPVFQPADPSAVF